MKNIQVFRKIKANLDANIVGQCVDVDNKRLFVLLHDFNILETQGDRFEVNPVKHDFDGKSIGIANTTSEDVILVEFVVETGSILVVLRQGYFVQIGVSSFSPPSGCPYKHSKDISSMKLSPDQDLIALADIDNNLLIMTLDFSTIYTSNALHQNESLHKPVGVGWGSKETQFFGLDGRPSKEKDDKDKVVLSAEELARSEQIQTSNMFKQFRTKQAKSTLIDWRGDGQLIATLTYIPETKRHYLKVWNRNLELQYMSEQLITMEEGLISWIPNGQYICCGQRREQRINEIALFEKNGMVHQRITLPTMFADLYIRDLSWSPDSKILAIIGVQFFISESNVNKRHILMLYTMQNFHYYLKYSSYLPSCNEYFIRWNLINQNRLHISSSSGQCYEYDCTFEVTFTQDYSTVAVMDANKILITPLNICNIPPPMFACKIELDTLIQRIIICPKSILSMFILTISNELIYISRGSSEAKIYDGLTTSFCLENESIKSFNQNLGPFSSLNIENGECYQNFTPQDGCFLVASKQDGSDCEVHVINLQQSTANHEVVTKIENKQIVYIAKNCTKNNLILLLDDSTCVELNLLTGEINRRFSIGQTAERLHVIDARYVDISSGAVVLLTQDYVLRLNEILLANCCTSFRMTENFLIYTTTENMMHFIPVNKTPIKENQCDIESWIQPIEAGGTLVIASEQDSKVILQMPRGNIEILHPRILVLLSITTQLDCHDYVGAMKQARRHRVDLNFLCDYLIRRHGESFFSETLNKFVLNIVEYDPSQLSLFITELSQDDSLSGRYENVMKFLPLKGLDLKSVSMKDKVNKICSSIDLEELRSFDRVQSKLLCLLKQDPRKIEAALRTIAMYETAEERDSLLKFLLYFINIEQLFLDALSTYDTDLALMVAGASTKDPKEYLALLDDFNAIKHEHLRRYRINLHIKNYEQAFKNLLYYFPDAPDQDAIKQELISLVESKRIYKYATREISDQVLTNVLGEDGVVDIATMLWSKYGDYLLEKRYHLEAGLAYSKSIVSFARNRDNFDKAIKCFLLIEDWERCLVLLTRYYVDEPVKEELLYRISKMLMDRGKFAEAIVVRQPIKDDRLANELIGSRSWHLGAFVATRENSLNVVKDVSHLVREEICGQCVVWKAELATAKSQFERLKELITTDQARRKSHLDADNCYTSDSLSTIDGSDASSIAASGQEKVARSGAPSIKTRTSSRSTKSQTERAKKINLKVGSRYEDIALILELKKFVSKQKSNSDLARSLVATDAEFSLVDQVDESMGSFNEILLECFELARQVQSQLWPKSDQRDQRFSLYIRFSDLLSPPRETFENVDFEILIRPEMPKTLSLLEF